ncbi:MAG: glycosyltransferase [Chloroflexi bacterium]|nr:glycosyltransferase [Chloroflexota bacterium]
MRVVRPRVSVLIPTYNRADLLLHTMHSVLAQDFDDFEVVVSDDCSTDDTREVAESFRDSRVTYRRNDSNLGYGGNLNEGARSCRGEFLYLLGHDDILLDGALRATVEAFDLSENVGLVTRPYYWFDSDPLKPVRSIEPPSTTHKTYLSINDGKKAIRYLFSSAGQLSGLAYRQSLRKIPFHPHIFVAHIYPFADILRGSIAVYLPRYTVAVRIDSSMTRHRPQIYTPSPTETWVQMFTQVFAGEEYRGAREAGVEFITSTNYEGLVQLRNYANVRVLTREIGALLRYRRQNLITPNFWAFALLTLGLPAPVLRRLTDAYKRQVLARRLGSRNTRLTAPISVAATNTLRPPLET